MPGPAEKLCTLVMCIIWCGKPTNFLTENGNRILLEFAIELFEGVKKINIIILTL